MRKLLRFFVVLCVLMSIGTSTLPQTTTAEKPVKPKMVKVFTSKNGKKMTDSSGKKLDWRLFTDLAQDEAGTKKLGLGQARFRKPVMYIDENLLSKNDLDDKSSAQYKKFEEYMRAEKALRNARVVRSGNRASTGNNKGGKKVYIPVITATPVATPAPTVDLKSSEKTLADATTALQKATKEMEVARDRFNTAAKVLEEQNHAKPQKVDPATPMTGETATTFDFNSWKEWAWDWIYTIVLYFVLYVLMWPLMIASFLLIVFFGGKYFVKGLTRVGSGLDWVNDKIENVVRNLRKKKEEKATPKNGPDSWKSEKNFDDEEGPEDIATPGKAKTTRRPTRTLIPEPE